MATKNVPRLITFDGEARSGKGTIAHFLKKRLETRGLKVMLIDRGQAFRGFVVSAMRSGVDPDDAVALDAFLTDELALENTVRLLKDIYAMSHEERDALLYTKNVGENSAKIGARPASQEFVYNLTLKWITDAKAEDCDVILMDGRALEALADDADSRGLCEYALGLYFICDPPVGARRTLGFGAMSYDELDATQREEVDDLVRQIIARNHADMTRDTQRLVRPESAPEVKLPATDVELPANTSRIIIDTSGNLTKQGMSASALRIIELFLHGDISVG